MQSDSVLKALEHCTSDSGNYIDMQKMRDLMGVKVHENSIAHPTLYAQLSYAPKEDETHRFYVHFRPDLSVKEKNTLCALLFAKLILNREKVKEAGADIDAFEYKGIKEMRYSRIMYLATRLAMPESEIDKMDSNSLNRPVVEALDHYTSELIDNAVSGHSVAVLLGNVT